MNGGGLVSVEWPWLWCVYLVVIEANGCATAVVNIVARCCMRSLGLTARRVITVSLGYIALVMRAAVKDRRSRVRRKGVVIDGWKLQINAFAGKYDGMGGVCFTNQEVQCSSRPACGDGARPRDSRRLEIRSRLTIARQFRAICRGRCC